MTLISFALSSLSQEPSNVICDHDIAHETPQ